MKSYIISNKIKKDDIEQKVHSFMHDQFQKEKSLRLKRFIVFFSIFFFLTLILTVFLIGNFIQEKQPSGGLTGFGIISFEKSFSDTLNLDVNESQEIEWIPENQGQLLDASVSGKLTLFGDGSVKIYLDDKLILDSSKLEQSQPPENQEEQNNFGGITGLAIDEIDTNVSVIPESNPEPNQTVENVFQENITQESPTQENFSQENITEENITEENVSAENITTKEIKFDNICVDTCDLKEFNLTNEKYNLKIYIENASLQLDKIDYSVLKVENQGEENLTNITNLPPELIKEIPNQEISINSSKKINLLEYFSDPENDSLNFNFIVLENENLTTISIETNELKISSKDVVGTQTIIITASDGNSSIESNVFSINVTENLTEMELVPIKEVFSSTEEPEFELREKNSKNTGNNEKSIRANNRFSQGNENLELSMYNEDQPLNNDIKIEKNNNKFKINLSKEKEFRPGKYILNAEYKKGNQKYSLNTTFYWGVLAINTEKSIYLPNEIANISIGVLDLAGRTFCNADVVLEIKDPENKKTTLTTKNGDIKISNECETRSFTYVPDYSTIYQTNKPGTYQMKLIATTNDGTYSIEDSFFVQENVPFDVSRSSVTRINPTYAYETQIIIKSNQDYSGKIIETVPSDFEIKTDGAVVKNGGIKEIEWQVSLKKGEEKILLYEFDAPDVWPMIFLTGPLQIGSWQEAREWQIASDTPANLILLWDDAVSDAPTGWSCISCGSGDFYGRFIRGYSSYGASQGGSATHSHSDPGTLTSTIASLPLGGTVSGGAVRPAASHTHTTTILSGLSANNLPVFRNLKVIKYNNGVPASLPSGVIAIFVSTPTGWTAVDNAGNYIRGNNTANVNSTGGNNTHTHAISLNTPTSIAADSSSKCKNIGGTIGGSGHSHAVGGSTSVANSSEPSYITVVLAKKDSAGAIPVGMIGMFDATPPTGWSVLSNNGGDFYQRFFKPTGTYGTTSDVSTHIHTNLKITTLVPNQTATTSATGITFSSNTHTHDFTVTFDSQDQTPVYWDVIFANATSAPSASLEQIHYHWRNDDNNEASATSATSGNEDTSLTNSFSENKRLRIEISNEGGVAVEDYQFRLEYKVNLSNCAVATGWTDVGALGGDWDMFDSPNLNEDEDTTNISVATGGVTDANPTFKTPNAAVKDMTSTLSKLTLTNEDFLEMEFSIKPNVVSGDYCFRITNAGTITNFVYTKYALVTVQEQDLTNPTASQGTNPVDNYNDSDGSIVFDLKCSDNVAVSWIQLWTNTTGSWAANYTNSSYTNNTWLNITVAGISDNSNYKWAVWCNDTSNNPDWSDSNRTFTVDKTNPTASQGTNPIDNYNDSDGSITFDMKCSDNVAVHTIQLWTNTTGSWAANYTNSSYTNNTWLNITVAGISETSNYKWAVYCNDTSGNSDWTDSNRTFSADINSPTPEQGTNPVASYNDVDGSITFDLKCSDAVGVHTIELLLSSGGPLTTNYSNSSYTNNTWLNITVDGIQDGLNQFWAVQCNDTTGHSVVTPNRLFNVDKTDPIANFGTNPVDYYNSSGAIVSFEAKCSDNIQVSFLKIYGSWDGGWSEKASLPDPANDTWQNIPFPVSDGLNYQWAVLCIDSLGHEDWTDTNRTLTVDTISPIPQQGTNPIDNYNDTDGSVTFDLSCSDNVAVHTIELLTQWQGQPLTTNYSNSSYTSGDWLNITVNGISDGLNHHWMVRCNDTVNHQVVTSARTLNVDKTDPIANFGTNPVDSYNDTDGIIDFFAKCSDNINPDYMQLWTNTTGSWAANFTWPPGFMNDTEFPTQVNGIPDGSNYKWAVYCNDSLGNSDWSDTNRTFNVDKTAPTASQGTNPIDNYNDSDGSITFDMKCSDNVAVHTIQLWTNTTGSWTANYTNSSYTNNTWLNITVSGISSSLNYKWAVYCNDSLGNSDWSDTNRTFNVDSVSPTASQGTNPIDNNNYSDSSIPFDFKCSDNIFAFKIEVWTNKTGSWDVTLNQVSPTNDTWYNVSDPGWTDGWYVTGVRCNDSFGNVDWSDSNRTFRVDLSAPTITLPTYTNATKYRNTQSMIFNISVSDSGVGPGYCSINVAGSTNQTVAVSNNWCNGTYSLSGFSIDGNQTINAYANDTLGNTALNDSFVVWLDSTPPTVTNTNVNDTEVLQNEPVCINVTASDVSTGIDKVWAYITYPNSTQSNVTMEDDASSCDGSAGDNVYGVDINVGSTTGTFTANTSYANDTAGNLGNQTPWSILNVTVASSNTAPTVDDLSNISDQSITEASVNDVVFYALVSDAQGNTTIATVNATFTNPEGGQRYNSSCVKVAGLNETQANYSCTIGLWYWDEAATWQVNVTAKDTGDLISDPYGENFTLLETTAIVISPTTITFPQLSPGSWNTTSDNDPTLINNTGNANVSSGNVQVKALDLVGETNASYNIPAANFSSGVTEGGECGATALQNNTFIGITGSVLPAGNNSAGLGQEQLYYCLRQAPILLTSQNYSTSALGSWVIRVVTLAVLVMPARRKKRKSEQKSEKNLGSKERLIEILRITLEELKEKHSLTTEDLLNVVSKEQTVVPISIFKKEKNLGALEVLCKYLKENLNFSFSKIAEIIQRDERTVWNSYKDACEKKSEKILLTEEKLFIPVEKFDRELTILESIIIFLRQKFSNVEVARLLGRDPRNIYSIYTRVNKKLK